MGGIKGHLVSALALSAWGWDCCILPSLAGSAVAARVVSRPHSFHCQRCLLRCQLRIGKRSPQQGAGTQTGGEESSQVAWPRTCPRVYIHFLINNSISNSGAWNRFKSLSVELNFSLEKSFGAASHLPACCAGFSSDWNFPAQAGAPWGLACSAWVSKLKYGRISKREEGSEGARDFPGPWVLTSGGKSTSSWSSRWIGPRKFSDVPSRGRYNAD